MTVLVVKISGSEGADLAAVCDDIAALVQRGQRVVFVHGTSAAATALAERVGLPVRMLTSPDGHSSRYTDPETLAIYVAAAAGQMNKQLVGLLQARGIDAVGLSGLDGRLLQAERKTAVRAVENGRQRIVRDDFTGKLTACRADLLDLLLDHGFTPVIAPLAIGLEAEPLNVDGDRAAALVAAALGAETLIVLGNVPGLLANFPDESSLIARVGAAEMGRAMQVAEGRMKRKVLAAQEAIDGGVAQVILADARQPQPIQAALNGAGTWITR